MIYELALFDRIEKLVTDERQKEMQKLSKRFYVIDPDGNVSWNGDKDSPEHFNKRQAAFQRAREMAATEPGQTVYVVETIEAVVCPVGMPERLGIA